MPSRECRSLVKADQALIRTVHILHVVVGAALNDLSSLEYHDLVAILKENADWLKGNPAVRVQIEGHCDERGAADYNMALGAKRAQAAMDYLATLGVAANRLSTISYGEEIPVCREHTEDCWAKNRRARFVAAQTKPTS